MLVAAWFNMVNDMDEIADYSSEQAQIELEQTQELPVDRLRRSWSTDEGFVWLQHERCAHGYEANDPLAWWCVSDIRVRSGALAESVAEWRKYYPHGEVEPNILQ